MRRVVVLLGLVPIVMLAGVAKAPAKTGRSEVRGTCNAKGVDIYFWPQGHPAIPAIGFPAFAPTHTEFYKGHDVSNTGQLGYMDVAQTAVSGNNCAAVADKAFAIAAGTPTQTTTQTQKLRCTFAANADIRISPWSQVKTRFVTKTIKVRGKKKKVRRAIKTTVLLGNLGTVGVTGGTVAAAEVRLSAVAGTSSLKWDTRTCVPVDVTG